MFGSSLLTLVRGSCRPCSSSTFIPIRNCSTSNGAVSQLIPISSPITRASLAVKDLPVSDTCFLLPVDGEAFGSLLDAAEHPPFHHERCRLHWNHCESRGQGG